MFSNRLLMVISIRSLSPRSMRRIVRHSNDMQALRRTVVTVLLALLALGARGATIEEEIRIVERIRGLQFTGPIRMVEINRSELPAHLRQQFAKSLPYSIEEWTEVLRAMRLVSEDAQTESIVSSLLDVYQSQVLAYYDPPTKTYY